MEKESSRTYLLLLVGVSWIFLLFPFPCDSRLYDMDVLLKMKSSLIGTNGSGLQDWEHSPAPAAHCSFSGVICDGVARVVSLNLSFFPLGGRIPPEIGFLDRLVNLSLAASNLTGALPLEMKNLTNLRVLNISNNVLSGGSFFGEILASMPELEVLDAYNNDFMGRLPAELSGMKKLKHLSLGGNFFSGEIPESYAEIQSLEYLGLNGIGLTGKTPAFLARLKNLREMYIGYYNAFVGGIPPEFDGLTKLRVLDMGSCNLTGEIPARLGNLKNLHSLFLQINNLTGNIPAELSNLVSLKSLDLSINQLSGEIPQSFSALKKITLINLFKNNLYGRIPSCVGDLPNLEVFQVWGNNFTFELPENLGRNGRLTAFDVSVNHLTGLIPPDLCRGGRLQTLILMDNFFFGTIPEGIGRCKSLTRIRMMKNLMNGTVPTGIFSLPLVTMIELNDNFFSGELPVKISGGALSQIYLSNNWFTGEIPPAIGNFSNLQILSLEGNRFRGQIPQEIFDLTHLTMINISDNNLTGGIPPTISRCVSLISIDLSRNNLTGEIPRGINNLTNLGTLNVSKNQLTGQIPSEIRSMTSLTTLDLSFNDLSGTVPIGGEFLAFNDTSFAGNTYLCLSHRLNCPRRQDKSSSHSHTASFSTSTLIIIIIILVAIAGVTLTISTVYGIHRKRNQRLRAWKLTAFQRLDFKAEDVLNCLKEENIIGKGGAGIVYRGSMPSGGDVAIKRLTGRGDSGFMAEIKTLGGIRHRNIVRLLGYVSNNHDANLLLYEYMPNGSLGEVLHGPKGGYLRWEARYRIAVEAAKGLCYLHHDCSPLIVHRDVKSNNILLGSGFEAHVADFGLARFLEQDGAASECMSAVAGSYGYIAPEYAYTLKVDEKSDVYSFGVVLLEMIAGKKPVGDFGDGVDIVRWVRMKIESEASRQQDAASVPAIMDSRLSTTTGDPARDYVEHMFKIAMLCVENEASARPTMRAVVQMLVAAAATDGC